MQALFERISQLARAHAGWVALAAALGLTVVGVEAIATVEPGFATKQARWVPIGLVAMALCLWPHPRVLGWLSYPLLGVLIGVLVVLILPFAPRSLVPIRNGATSWVDLGMMSIQPSELAKIAFVMAMAWYLRYRASYRTLRGLIVPFVIMLVPVGLILKQPDLGTALLFAPTLLVMLVAAGAKLRHLGALVGLGGAAVALVVAVTLYAPDSMQLLQPHQQDRIRSMLSLAAGETRYLDDDAYQQAKAMTLVGAGQLTGYGDTRATTILEFNHLPFDHNDMIFAVIASRWGLLGALGVIALYLLLIGSFLAIAARSKDPFARMCCVGFAGMVFTQTTINIGMTVGLLPITGITLPLISYGGSSLLATFLMVGLAINFASRRPTMMSRPSFEFDQHADAIFQ